MADNKKYYWLKLKRDFFKRHDVRIIEEMPNGKDYILFYLKLLLESIDHEGELRFSDTIPYNEQMLSVITNTNIDIVRSAMKVLIELRMIDILDDQTIFMTETRKLVGSESKSAQRVRRHRENQKALQCNTDVTKSNTEKEKEKELEKKLETKKEKKDKKDKSDIMDKSEVSPFQPSALTKELIECGYISEDDIYIDQYNDIMSDLSDSYSFEIVRSCLWYFTKRFKDQPKDEDGNEIENKVAYFRTAMHNGAKRLDRDNNKEHSGVGSWLFS